MPQLTQPTGKMHDTLRCPQQKRLRIAPPVSLHQPLKVLQQRRVELRDRLTPTTPPAHPPRLNPFTRRQLPHPLTNRRDRDPRRASRRRDPTAPRRTRLRRRPQPALTLVQPPSQRPELLPDRSLIRHALIVLRQHAALLQRYLSTSPERLTIDVDATLITAHSEKEQAAGNYKGGYGFHPLQVYLDETREALAGLLRPGNAGSNTAEDHRTVIDLALAQVPPKYIETLEILVRADSAGATHGLIDYCRGGNMPFSVGYELTEPVRQAILQILKDAWVPALDQDGSERAKGYVAGITDTVDLSAWGKETRLIVRRERPHPGAQLSFTDHDGYRFQAILTDQPDDDIAVIECRHRQHAHVEDRIRDDKDTGLAKFPFKAFALNEVWLEIVMLAHDLLVWTQALALDGELAKAEPKRLRYRLLHVAGRLAFSGRRAKLHLQDTWPWAAELVAAFAKLKTLAAATG